MCIGKRATVPYQPKFSEFSLYSIEELCYYFIERSYVIHEDLVSMELVDWIRDECQLPDLANLLTPDVKKKVTPAIIVTTILEYTRIYNDETIKKTQRILKELSSLRPFERWKQRADYYYQMGRFRQAMDIYFYLLENLSEDESDTKAVLFFDIASILALQFDYERACVYYEKSYAIVPQRQTLIAMLMAKKMGLNDYNYGIYRRENPQWEEEFLNVEERISQADAKWQESRTKQILDNLCNSREEKTALIKNLKKDYRRLGLLKN